MDSASRCARYHNNGATDFQFTTDGLIPFGWNNRRITLRVPPTRSHTSAPITALMRSNATFDIRMFQARSMAIAGNGSWFAKIMRTAAITCDICGSSKGRALNTGANPAAVSQSFRSRKGTSKVSLSCRIMARLGLARPDSRKLTWRCETPDESAKSSCDSRRR